VHVSRWLARWSRLHPPHHPPPSQEEAYVTSHANASVAALHAMVIAVLNIKSMITILLNILSPHYNQWKILFLNSLTDAHLDDVIDPHF
jgi:hypothetical protein